MHYKSLSVGLLMLFLPLSVLADGWTYSCNATSHEFNHGLSIQVEDGVVTAFHYESVNQQTGDDCQAVVARHGVTVDGDYFLKSPNRRDVSIWADTPQGLHVTESMPLSDHADPEADVLVTSGPGWYSLTLMPKKNIRYCGMSGVIAPTVVLTIGKKECTLMTPLEEDISGSVFTAPTGPVTPDQEAKLLADYKQYLKEKHEDYRPPLVWAVVDNQMWFADMFLRHGEPVDQEEASGGNALSAAILNQNEEAFDLLVKHGADLNMKFSHEMNGVEPIILAGQGGDAKIVRELIAAHADINYMVPDRYQTTPLYQALFNKHVDAARLLIDAGAKFKPYRFADGSLAPSVVASACELKPAYPVMFKGIDCAKQDHDSD